MGNVPNSMVRFAGQALFLALGPGTNSANYEERVREKLPDLCRQFSIDEHGLREVVRYLRHHYEGCMGMDRCG